MNSYIKPGFNLVIELGDGVEYLIDTEAIVSIKNEEKTVVLKRLFDQQMLLIPTSKVITALSENGPTDYLEVR